MRISVIVTLVAFFASCNASTFDPRIVNGQKATIGQFPYYAFLNVHLADGGSACGASLLSDEWLLTAAHCLRGALNLEVVLGESQLDHLEGSEAIAIPVKSDGFYTHPEYSPQTASNDIALIHMPVKVPFTKNIKPVSLPAICAEPAIDDVVVVGHGKTSDNGKVSMQLNYAHLTTIPLNVCEKVFPIVTGRKSVICAMRTEPGYQSVCNGDSGGPMVRLSDRTLIGISCFVRLEGCETGLPQGFTNVYSYLNWIKNVTKMDLPPCSSGSLFSTSQIFVLIAFLLGIFL